MSKVMIVDDNKDIVETLKMIMEKEGHLTEVAYNGQEFLDKVGSAKPDLVLLDVMMPGLTTKQILEKVRERNISLKIILVTVVRFSEEEKQSLFAEFKIADYVPKPFDIDTMVKKVKEHLVK